LAAGVGVLVAAVSTLALVPLSASAAPFGSISGTVTDEATHNPVAGVPVCAVIGRFEDGEERFCSQSDGAGEYEIDGLGAAEYSVEFTPGDVGLNYLYEAWQDQRVWVSANPVTVAGAAVEGIDAELSEGGELSGRITNALTGSPVAGVEVCAEAEDLNVEEGCATSDSGGNYTIYGLGTSKYVVSFIAPESDELLPQYWDHQNDLLAAEPVGVTIGSVTEGVDAALIPGARISGRVTDAMTGAPVPAVTACVFDVATNFIGECGETNAVGAYTIRRLPAGTYTVRLFVEGGKYSQAWYTGSVCAHQPLPVSAAAGQETSGIDVQLIPEEFAPSCGPPSPPPAPPRAPIKILGIRSRADGTVAVEVRSYRSGELTLVARTAAGRRHTTVARKRLAMGAGHHVVKLRLNGSGHRLLRQRGKLRAALAVTFAPRVGDAVTYTRKVLFRP
jgi:Carboxypeptidase regulatory-like domain